MYDKFKRLLTEDTFFYGMVIILVGVLCFGLGRWSVSDTTALHKGITQKMELQLQEAAVVTVPQAPAKAEAATTSAPASATQLVGSRNGTKYHLLWCAGAKQIKEENKVYFASKEEAEKAGYTPASNCKGL